LSTEIRTRFAPSPTGYLHIGGVRTALYNYLFARKNNGKFILRIEDTDLDRSNEEYTKVIIDGMKWIGLEWDEGPFYQSKRQDKYNGALKELIEKKKVYKCYCSAQELKTRREEAMKQGGSPGYDGRCFAMSEEDKKACEAGGKPFVWRLRVPENEEIKFNDIIKGEITVNSATVSDFVIMKSSGVPTYNFACVVDDLDMKISHVIRGDDHISNTPKQILIYEALEKKIPQFAHLPQVHGTDGKRLSKRTGAVALDEYREQGYLPEALRNYLALIGWSTQDSQQLFEWEELKEKFDLSRCSKSAGIFDAEKLNWMNGKYIRSKSAEELAEAARPWLERAGLAGKDESFPDKLIQAVELEKEKLELLSQLPQKIDFILQEKVEYEEKAVSKRLKKEGAKEILENMYRLFKTIDRFTKERLEEEIRNFCEQNNIGFGKVFHPVRVAVSGRMTGPGLFELLEILGRQKVLDRIEYAKDNLAQ